jgi:hypothetical protein
MLQALSKLRFYSLGRQYPQFGTKVVGPTVKEIKRKLPKKSLLEEVPSVALIESKVLKTATKKKEINVSDVLSQKKMSGDIDHSFIYTDRQKLIVNGFKHFKGVMGHCNIAFNFVVLLNDPQWPSEFNSLRLGQILSDVRRLNLYSAIQPALSELGFNIEPLIKYETMRDALVKYKELEGHAQVPCDFRVPHGDNRYPEHTRGLHLGFAVHSAQVNGCYEQHHDELKQLGVNFKIIGARHTSFDVIYRAATSFCELHPGKIIPVNFVVPFGDDKYPEDTWGLQLGVATRKMLSVPGFYPEHKEKFKKLVANDPVPKVSFDVIFSALKAYKVVCNNLLVPQKFVVFEGDVRFPVETWGIKLGRNVYHIRSRGDYSEHRAKLEELGVIFEVEKNQKWDFLTQIYPALEAYKAVYGDLLVPQKFVVAQGDANFSKDIWGRMNLGNIVHDIRNDDVHLKYKERLTALGFVYESIFDVQFDVIYSALEAYKVVFGNLLVPQKFVVSDGDVRFPADTWRMKLGFSVSNIRNRGDYSEHKAKLEELGFVFKKNKKVVEIE